MELARRGARLHLACRSREKGLAAVGAVSRATGSPDVRFTELNLGDFASIRACAEAFLASGEPLHALINNAGIAGNPGLTADGFERTFGVNHLGHFLLTNLLLARLTDSRPARVVTVSSNAHKEWINSFNVDAVQRRTKTTTGRREYAVSKLANVAFTQELARRTAGTGVTAYALHPGVVASDIWRRVPWPIRPLLKRRMITNEQGAQTSLYCATSPDVAEASGRYYDECHEAEVSPLVTPEFGRDLWARSERWTRLAATTPVAR
jgi:NAD(P)-dependent dehydrogenase (short-subunit alcohol dehydrogenase family)